MSEGRNYLDSDLPDGRSRAEISFRSVPADSRYYGDAQLELAKIYAGQGMTSSALAAVDRAIRAGRSDEEAKDLRSQIAGNIEYQTRQASAAEAEKNAWNEQAKQDALSQWKPCMGKEARAIKLLDQTWDVEAAMRKHKGLRKEWWRYWDVTTGAEPIDNEPCLYRVFRTMAPRSGAVERLAKDQGINPGEAKATLETRKLAIFEVNVSTKTLRPVDGMAGDIRGLYETGR